ncbi:MAG: AAA family ATPase [Nanoarchaeota archaeon]|nr:AAA family ATPase [Nanoarchaeota archaeon]
MLLQNIKIENIRSYTNQEINFPEGRVLLSGDIGSGKSSVLLAVEFALFGIKRKHLSGAALLRNGKKQGSVELKFKIGNKDIIIKRTLKKSKDEVKQDSGYIIIDGTKREGTAVELKSTILELLGYPGDLLKKSKDMVFRYTVYTPQEEMKKILSDETDSRLDTLRIVFGIDKYKQIRENSSIITKHIRENLKEAGGKIFDLDEKQKQSEEKNNKIKEIDEKIKTLEPKINEVKERLEQKKKEIAVIEKDIQELNKLSSEFDVNDANLSHRIEQRAGNIAEIEKQEKEILELKKELKEKEELNPDELKSKIKQKQDEIGRIEKDVSEISKKISELEAKKQHSSETKEKITGIDQCPTCEQKVSDEHKRFITQREDENIVDINETLKSSLKKQEELNKNIALLKQEWEELRKKESLSGIIKVRLVHLNEKSKLVEKLKKENEAIKKEIGTINLKKSELNKKIEILKPSGKKYEAIKKEYDGILSSEKDLEIIKAELASEKQVVSKMIIMLKQEIDNKLKIKEKIVYLKEINNWLNDYFANLMGVIERHVMLRIVQEFNELFKEWFNALIEDETINVSIDDSFTPVIEQNGYEIDFENLSGGERTSIALAYRLSLNKVINDLISNIKTKDLIILDEPTDGFSTEQLDKVRVVLDQLNIKQVIIVSHESKIESFVDNVIRINKNEHVSGVV